jgi:hypothetical protein
MGAAGQAVAFAYHAEAFDDVTSVERTQLCLDVALRGISTTATKVGLFVGYTGVGWAIEHLAGRSDQDPNVAIDRAVAETLTREWDDPDDLIAGLAGVGIYVLERPSNEQCLMEIARQIVGAAEPMTAGVAWRTPPDQLPPWQLEIAPDGYRDLGVAHGAPGAIGVLARIAGRVDVEGLGATMDGAVRWILAQRDDDLPGASLPAWITVTGERSPARLGWCYGDLGVAATLHAAGTVLDAPSWVSEAHTLASRAAMVSIEDAEIDKPGICHGAFGNAHMFNRLFQVTGDERLRSAAVRWFERGFEMCAPGTDLAGFEAHFRDPGVSREAGYGLLDGIAGIAMTIIAAITPNEPEWDRVLLLS